MNLDLVYLSDNTYGGWVTFTRHLHDALRMLDVNVRIVKIRKSCYDGRSFGYGCTYAARTLEALRMENSVKLIVAIHKNYAEAAAALLVGSKRNAIVVHDYNELKHLPVGKLRTVVIRKINTTLIPNAVFIPHPYVPVIHKVPLRKSVLARSVSRIDHDKNTTMLLDANRLLPSGKKIDIHGFENRIYTRFTVMPKYPEWVQSKVAFPREVHAAWLLLAEARYMVDMSVIKGDGGGSQYTFLEAIDAEACCVLNSTWCSVKGEMVPGKNCLVASTPEELVRVLTRTKESERAAIVQQAHRLLKFHEPRKIAAQYLEFMGG